MKIHKNTMVTVITILASECFELCEFLQTELPLASRARSRKKGYGAVLPGILFMIPEINYASTIVSTFDSFLIMNTSSSKLLEK